MSLIGLLSGAVDKWFLVLCALGFLYSANKAVNRFETTLVKFENLFSKIFEKHEDFEKRLSRIEGAHSVNHSPIT